MTNEISKIDAAASVQARSSLNSGDMLARLQVVSAMNNADSLNDHMDEVLRICDYIIMPGVRKGRGNNPDVECQNTYLVDVDKNVYFTQSDGVAKTLEQYLLFCPDLGKETMPNGYLPLMCVSRELSNGNTIKTLVIAE